MSKLGKVLALAGAAASGYVKGDQMRRRDDMEAEDRAWTQEQRGQQREAQQREKQTRISLASAAAPTAVEEGAGGAIRPVTMDNRDVGMPGEAPLSLGNAYRAGGSTYADRAQADAAAAQYNSPDATAMRVADATMASDPAKAISLRNAVQTQQQNRAKLTREQEEYAKKAVAEGYAQTGQAMLRGDPNAVFQAFNKQGTMKLKEPPTVTPREIEVPGLGKVKSYDYTGTMIGPDGTEQQGTINSHEFNMGLLPYKDRLELQRKGTDSDNKATYQQGLLDNKIRQLELAGQVAEAKALAAAAKASAGGGTLGREERLRFTTLFTDAGRRMQDVQKTISTLRKDPIFMGKATKEGSPEAVELQSARDNLTSLTQERQLYQGLLAGTAEGKKPSLADAEPRPRTSVKVNTQAERDKLPKGARYIAPDGSERVKN